MTEGGGSGPTGGIPRSRLQDYAELVESPTNSVATTPATTAAGNRREFAALLGEFRRTAVLLPLSDDGFPLVGDFGGVRWLYAFSDEAALARFAAARGAADRAWEYEQVLGARLLDAVAPALGVPCGMAVDVGSPGDELLLPPVIGVVPDPVAVDAGAYGEGGGSE
ncbi:hypothetical protein AB0M68_08350 [Streptomyces sp. NPDC051453]|uniref:hypothetical protein n=1 Tax=Streptomyces sp. NPDC051453 TaxID=3154941 RepID=UPI0034256EAD